MRNLFLRRHFEKISVLSVLKLKAHSLILFFWFSKSHASKLKLRLLASTIDMQIRNDTFPFIGDYTTSFIITKADRCSRYYSSAQLLYWHNKYTSNPIFNTWSVVCGFFSTPKCCCLFLAVAILAWLRNFKDECQGHALRACIVVFVRVHTGHLHQIAIKITSLVYLHFEKLESNTFTKRIPKITTE